MGSIGCDYSFRTTRFSLMCNREEEVSFRENEPCDFSVSLSGLDFLWNNNERNQFSSLLMILYFFLVLFSLIDFFFLMGLGPTFCPFMNPHIPLLVFCYLILYSIPQKYFFIQILTPFSFQRTHLVWWRSGAQNYL